MKNQMRRRKKDECKNQEAASGDDSSLGKCSTRAVGSFTSVSSLNENFNAVEQDDEEKKKIKEEKDQQIRMLLQQKKAEKQVDADSDTNVSK